MVLSLYSVGHTKFYDLGYVICDKVMPKLSNILPFLLSGLFELTFIAQSTVIRWQAEWMLSKCLVFHYNIFLMHLSNICNIR